MSPTTKVTTRELVHDCNYIAAYEQAFTPAHAVALTRRIPLYMYGPLVAYILIGKFPGSFLSAFLEGDLFAAISYADDTNRKLFHEYSMFLYNYAPSNCFGDPDSVQRWGERGGFLGLEEPTP